VDPVRSPLLRVWFSLPPATEMFQLAGCPPSRGRYSRRSELPHSETPGSVPASGSPGHIGAVPRPSSARSARASIVCSWCLPSTPGRGGSPRWVSGEGGPETRRKSYARQLVRYGAGRKKTEQAEALRRSVSPSLVWERPCGGASGSQAGSIQAHRASVKSPAAAALVQHAQSWTVLILAFLTLVDTSAFVTIDLSQHATQLNRTCPLCEGVNHRSPPAPR
jgi:hypothetical protein